MCGEDKRWQMPEEEIRLREAIMADVNALLPAAQFGPVRAVLRSLIVNGHRCDEAARQLDLIMRGKLDKLTPENVHYLPAA